MAPVEPPQPEADDGCFARVEAAEFLDGLVQDPLVVRVVIAGRSAGRLAVLVRAPAAGMPVVVRLATVPRAVFELVALAKPPLGRRMEPLAILERRRERLAAAGPFHAGTTPNVRRGVAREQNVSVARRHAVQRVALLL